MLTEICAEIRNYFPTEKRYGEFTISGGSIAPLDFLQEGQYFRIVGSVFNDGVHKYPASDLTDEVFEGAVWAMSPKPDFLKAVEEQEELNKKVKELCLVEKGFASESWGGYSYQFSQGAPYFMVEWQNSIKKRIYRHRRIAE